MAELVQRDECNLVQLCNHADLTMPLVLVISASSRPGLAVALSISCCVIFTRNPVLVI